MSGHNVTCPGLQCSAWGSPDTKWSERQTAMTDKLTNHPWHDIIITNLTRLDMMFKIFQLVHHHTSLVPTQSLADSEPHTQGQGDIHTHGHRTYKCFTSPNTNISIKYSSVLRQLDNILRLANHYSCSTKTFQLLCKMFHSEKIQLQRKEHRAGSLMFLYL